MNEHRPAIVDIGSNSVRLGILRDGRWEKQLITTRLGEGAGDGTLKEAPIARTLTALGELIGRAVSQGADSLAAFATEAVRRAGNGDYFLSLVKEKFGLNVTLVSGEEEALLAVEGALDGDGAVIDLGGASCELAVKRGGKLVYSRSVGIGAVSLFDAAGRDKNKLVPYISQKTAEYGAVPPTDTVTAIGGTATSVAACLLGLKVYDPNKTHGYVTTPREILALSDKLGKMTPEGIDAAYPVGKRRAEIIFGGALLLYAVLGKAGAKRAVISESDNIEGFYSLAKKGTISANFKKIGG